jgi:hypothetical protein
MCGHHCRGSHLLLARDAMDYSKNMANALAIETHRKARSGNHMMMPKLLSIAGGLILFGSWVTQTTLYERWKDKVASMDRADSIYVTMLSSVFILQSFPRIGEGEGHFFEDYNYMLFKIGLDYMVRGLPRRARIKWSKQLSSTQRDDFNTFGLSLMEHVRKERVSLEKWKVFFCGYLLPSISREARCLFLVSMASPTALP